MAVPIGPGAFATTSYTYNSLGQVLTTTDLMGNVTNNSYDGHGNLLTVTSPPPNSSTAGSSTQFAYDPKGELTQISDPLGNVTQITYYPTGLINTIKDVQQNVTTYVYDTHGNRNSVTDAMQNQTTFAYDSGDRLKTITYPGTTDDVQHNRARHSSMREEPCLLPFVSWKARLRYDDRLASRGKRHWGCTDSQNHCWNSASEHFSHLG